jgi:hypothetical protein
MTDNIRKTRPGDSIRTWCIWLLAVLAVPAAIAGENRHTQERGNDFISSGDLRTDILSISHQPLDVLVTEGNQEVHRKSPYLAAGLSVVLPGAGEFYSESYWKGAIFIVAEATLWTLDIIYNGKGDTQTDFYKKYADDHWSAARYAEWINANLQYLNPSLDKATYAIPINSNTSLPPWERIDWKALGRVEHEIGGGFSHSLAPYGDQQYFEMIGKYMQFIHGWDQTDFNTTTYMDQLTPQMTWYAGERGKANDFYNIASTAVTILVLNHVLSAFDAAWSAHSHNTLHTEVTMQKISTPLACSYFPTVTLSVNF